MPRSNPNRLATLTPVPVDLALVLAIDSSGSVSEARLALQINGYAGAFRTPELLSAVQKGHLGRIAASFVEWSDPDRQMLAVDWSVISDAESAQEFGRALTEAMRPTPGWTSISGAIDYSARLFARSGVVSTRRVIDISGDGPNNAGRPVTDARDAAVAANITINGLPILEVEPQLDAYYRDHVVGGPDAFIVAVSDLADFAGAVLRKLLVEVAGIDPSARLRG
jgi:Protein of unknown function (DUF1194)